MPTLTRACLTLTSISAIAETHNTVARPVVEIRRFSLIAGVAAMGPAGQYTGGQPTARDMNSKSGSRPSFDPSRPIAPLHGKSGRGAAKESFLADQMRLGF